MKKIYLSIVKCSFILFFFGLPVVLFGQTSVRIITVGEGNTYQSAVSASLRNALEQVAGVYITNVTAIKNDSLLFDETSSLSRGTISKYTVINSYKDSLKKSYFLTVESEIIPQKFLSLAKQLDDSIEFNGSAFFQNIKLNELYKKNEPEVLLNSLYKYFDLIDTNFERQSCLYLRDWSKLFDSKIEILGGDPTKFEYIPLSDLCNLEIRIMGSGGFESICSIDRLYWNDPVKKEFNYKFSKEIFDASNVTIKVGQMEYKGFRSINLVLDKKISFDSGELLDSVYYFSGILEYCKNVFDSIALANGKRFTGFFSNIDDGYKYNNETFKEFTDWWWFRLDKVIERYRKEYNRLTTEIKSLTGRFVFNLIPKLIPNTNYKNFLEELENIVRTLSVNQDSSFNKISYEKNNDKLYVLNFYDYDTKKLKQYYLRNEISYHLFLSVIHDLYVKCCGSQFVYEGRVRTFDDKILNTLLFAPYIKTENTAIDSEITYPFGNVIVNNPPNQMNTLGWLQGSDTIIGLTRLFGLSAFYSLDELEKVQGFKINTD